MAVSSIKRQRIILGITRTELAYQAGVSYASVASYESGIREPTATVICRMARTLDCHPEELLDEKWKAKRRLKSGKKTKPISKFD